MPRLRAQMNEGVYVRMKRQWCTSQCKPVRTRKGGGMLFRSDRKRDLMALPLMLAPTLWGQTTPANIGPNPPPRVNADFSVTYFLNAPNAKEVLLADTAVSPGPPGRPLTKGPDGAWTV